jgi:aldehyde:ferredoxin oxidoreductase
MVSTLDRFLNEYYQLRGWTGAGVPSREKLEELGLGYVVKDIEPFWRKKEGTEQIQKPLF